ncbi:HFCD family protein [Candidatus Contubernalis alkaliaceticus]|uniref:hypothetical protein n=1 Tax=Candidatus Contubernalis alkaliaceticus TaxID=338645 RepID=UPI001F4C2EB4|nr:hypothetical protein [Candidatus Contubernalis alkalaceticus]UNC93431.1 hypothetical protein HUE98_15910 [Candidatus Contubernalis alkalaceticus]
MILKEKKIVFLICDMPDLSDRVVEEIQKMLEVGARIRAYLVSSNAGVKVRSSLKKKLNLMGVSFEEIPESFNLIGHDYVKEMDLLVAAPCPPWLWKQLVSLRLPERVSLVVAPAGLDAGTRDLICYLGDLMKKERTYFVPFGPVFLKPEEALAAGSGERVGSFLSRMELLKETAQAAADNLQIEPYLLVLETLPH